jgi:hypothetical protein
LAEAELSDDFLDGEVKGIVWATTGSLLEMTRNNFRSICRSLAEGE